MGSTYLEVQREKDGNWITEYTDADWSTKLAWNQTAANESVSDVNLFTALFDVIAETTNYKFNIHEAIKRFESENWIEEVFTPNLDELSHKERKKR